MTDVKTYRDGARFILVVENCTGELANKVNRFIADILGPAEIEPVPAIIPERTDEEPQPNVKNVEEITAENKLLFEAPAPEDVARNLPIGGISGTLGRAIDTGDTGAIVSTCMECKNLGESMRHTVLAMCKKYILQDCLRRTPDCTPTSQIKRFFEMYKPLIEAATKEILEQAGYEALNDFFDLADEYAHQAAYSKIIECIIARVS